MSKKFYLNDCLPVQTQNGTNVVDLFHDMVLGYRDMHKNRSLSLDPSWVISDTFDKVTLCGMSLQSLLAQLKTERDLYGYACRLVTGGSVISYEEPQLAGDTELTLNFLFNGRNAHNLLVAQKLDMIAASMPVENTLCVDSLDLIYTDSVTRNQVLKEIKNWYINNRDDVVRLLTPPLPPETEPWNRLIAMLSQHGKVKWSKIFEDEWDKLGKERQQLIVARFKDALDGGLLFPANSNNMNIVKPDQKDRTSKVHELRQIGDGFRVYFECDDDAIFIALFATKTHHCGANQEADFRYAKTIVSRLRKGIM